MGLEGETLTLSCNYSGSVNYLFWYRQSSGSSPQLIISGFSDQTGEKFSFKHKNKQKEFDLQISSAAVTDSAVYYCALQPTVTGNSTTLYKNLWSKDNTKLHNIHQRDSHTVSRVSCEKLSAEEKEVSTLEGSSVTLSYNYPKLTTSNYFFWYRLYPGKPPEFLISHSASGLTGTEKVG
ncbi:unnamed protein product [Menidia menidia]|uniref:(Atlantic silverside) hypothetical protein n=1 Tax=Menidia menidia TaxID=238744 RepID=A0A8S4AGU0_9TELE|nr:unnamed protein product [Menidia menidia]